MEYVVLNSGFGDFDIEKCNPLGTVKSSMAVEYMSCPAQQYSESVRTIGGPRDVGIEVVFIPSCCFVVASQDISRERMH